MVTGKSEEVDKPSLDNDDDGKIVVYVDLTKAFTTDKAFASHADLIDWARHVGRENDYVVIVTRSNYRSEKRKPMITLRCEHGGKYRQVGHSFVGRLNPDEKALVGSMIEKRVKPNDILIAIREKNSNNLTRIKQIYNEKQSYNRIKRGPFTKIQHLIKLLEGEKYAHRSRVEGAFDVIKSLFWAHPNCIHLFNEFPTVVLMDGTYKTNRYRIPLLEMVEVTSTNLTYSIAKCFLLSCSVPSCSFASSSFFLLFNALSSLFLSSPSIC
ncbi:uncharacterized protein LOC130729656 [Lotus japonicus]|uniref:uncharacterized protein LOC130729656 n=1 Tax=Lotus japonicus TaxID=34305 RepID=UPI002589977F|nr:uncharacterized protein LOC130729656 [Lotus japonicus]